MAALTTKGKGGQTFQSGLILLAGIALVATAAALHAILLEPAAWTAALAAGGLALTAWGGYRLRRELASMVRGRRGEIALNTLGVIGVLVALAYLTARFPYRLDMTEAKLYSLSEQTVTMLKRLENPVHIVFFHDPMMRETVELYELIARQTDKISVEFYDPMTNPAQARMLGVQFAGTALMRSGERKLQVHGASETDIANGILRVSRGATQRVCFLDGHGEADPFSLESHDHLEGAAGHTHGIGAKVVVHERHGMAKARNALETMNYLVEKVTLPRSADALANCGVSVVAGPKSALLPAEVTAIRDYLSAGGNALFMLDPFVATGLEPVMREVGVVLDNTIVIDPASHFWADPSSPAVTDYNRHQVTRELPLTFFPGARSLSPTPKPVPGTSIVALVNSSKSSFGETSPDRVQFSEGKDVPGPATLMVIVNRKADSGPSPAADPTAQSPAPRSARRSRVVVIGDSDFATNSFFHIMGNGNLFLNSVNYLAAQENLIGIEPRTFDIPRVNLTNRQMKGSLFLSIVLIPALLALVGTAVWWKQR